MRLYIAGPMTGIKDYNYPAFHAAKAQLLEAGYEVESPADHPLVDVVVWADYMRKDIPMLLGCDAVALLPDWETSRGAKLETYIANALDMPIQRIGFWLKKAEEEAA